jgi:carbonic anhydrase
VRLVCFLCACLIFGCYKAIPNHVGMISEVHTAEEALSELKYGNNRFLDNSPRNTDYLKQIELTKKAQHPHSFVLSCIDSRIPPEIIFDQGIGHIFVARVAGNIESKHILGSMEYAVTYKGTKLIVVLGHGNCGAINGSLDSIHIGNLSSVLDDITIAHKVNGMIRENDVTLTTLNNIRHTIADIQQSSPILDSMIRSKTVKIVGAYYDVKSGEVRFIDE